MVQMQVVLIFLKGQMVEKLINKKHGLGWRPLHLHCLTGCYSQETMNQTFTPKTLEVDPE